VQGVQTGRVRKVALVLGWALATATAACSPGPIALHAPNIAPSPARSPTPLEIEPIVEAPAAAVAADVAAPGPAAVLTVSMTAEIAGRALRGGEPGGYSVHCKLDRFALRSRTTLADGRELLVLYADLSCEARRVSDGAIVWRGELRGRAAASAPNIISSDANVTQRLADRAMSDAGRELASDLAVRALGLHGEASARVFGDEGAMRAVGGLDDSPYGPAALLESPAAVEGAMRALAEHDAPMRAAAWNVAAMAAGPGDPWTAGDRMALDDDPLVRFVQYKALARLGTPAARARLEQSVTQEDDPLLAEFVHDALGSGGIGVPRKPTNEQ
jgi:hypothetical protein